MRLAVRGVPKGALRTHSAQQSLLRGSLVTGVDYCLRVRQCSGFVSLFPWVRVRVHAAMRSWSPGTSSFSNAANPLGTAVF